uniref:protein FAM3C-like isoform X2 n=1 Tax=Scatophagus argus TaxID=75038 RepID=UPI001ED7D8DA|nr:protein FAM3C-like isoform X2 [Scatophagus argus]
MLTVRLGTTKMARRQNFRRWVWLLVPLVVLIVLVLQKYSHSFTADWHPASSEDFDSEFKQTPKLLSKLLAGPCVMNRDCPDDQFSFFIRSGAANVVAPKICLQNKLVLGTALNNAGVGINIVIVNGKSGEVMKTDHFDMYSGDVTPLIDFLKSIQEGSIVLMASYDEPSSKLNEEARKLIADLGSTVVHSLSFRDNWVFVGGKGATVKSNFEKHVLCRSPFTSAARNPIVVVFSYGRTVQLIPHLKIQHSHSSLLLLMTENSKTE